MRSEVKNSGRNTKTQLHYSYCTITAVNAFDKRYIPYLYGYPVAEKEFPVSRKNESDIIKVNVENGGKMTAYKVMSIRLCKKTFISRL